MKKQNIRKDILYVGKEYFNRVSAICGSLSIKQITNNKDLQRYMKDMGEFYSHALKCSSGTRSDVEKAFFPLLVLSEPDIREERKSIKSVPCGPLTILIFNEDYVLPKGYLIVDDKTYERKKGSPKNACEKHNISIIKTSELESKLKPIVEEIFGVNPKLK